LGPCHGNPHPTSSQRRRRRLVAHAQGAAGHLCAGASLAVDGVVALLGQLLLGDGQWKPIIQPQAMAGSSCQFTGGYVI